jgi:AraC-like DNA-binding protein
MTTNFSTSDITERDRLEFWQDVVCRTYVAVSCESLDHDIAAKIAVYPFGAGQLSQTACSATTYARTPDDIRRFPSDELQLCLIREGSLGISQGGQETLLRPGDIGLYDAERPFLLHFGEQFRCTNLKLPRPVLAARVPNVNKLMAQRFAGDSRLGALVNSVISESEKLLNVADEQLITKLSGSVIDIVSASIENELLGLRGSESRQSVQVERIKRYMIEQLSDPELDITRISSECHVAPRTVHRLFAIEGTTVIRWLWQQRLAASYRMLAEGSVRQVSEAAINCGFSDFSHFARSFKKAFGVVPHSLLRELH